MNQIEVNMAGRKVQKAVPNLEIDEAKEFIETTFPAVNQATKNRILNAWENYVRWSKG